VAFPIIDQVLVLVHAKMFRPATALVWKNSAPVEHAAGMAVPVLIVRVTGAFEKSMFFVCVAKSTVVCPQPLHTDAVSRLLMTNFFIFSSKNRYSYSDRLRVAPHL
jgi:hypothetical protein